MGKDCLGYLFFAALDLDFPYDLTSQSTRTSYQISRSGVCGDLPTAICPLVCINVSETVLAACTRQALIFLRTTHKWVQFLALCFSSRLASQSLRL
jgi:hypothetical protein